MATLMRDLIFNNRLVAMVASSLSILSPVVVLIAALYIPNLGHSKPDSCSAFYGEEPDSSSSATQLIKGLNRALKSNKGGLELHTITQSLKTQTSELSLKYKNILEKIEEHGLLNTLRFSISTTEVTLNSFSTLNKKLDAELEKLDSNEAKILGLTRKMKSCLSNISTCEANLNQGIQDAQRDVQEALNLIGRIKSKITVFDETIAQLASHPDFPPEIIEMIRQTLREQKRLFESRYIEIIESHLNAQNSYIEIGKGQLQTIRDTRAQAAHLEAKGAEGLDMLSLKAQQRVALPQKTETGLLLRKLKMLEGIDPSFVKEIEGSPITPSGQRAMDWIISNHQENILKYLVTENSIQSLRDLVEIADLLITNRIQVDWLGSYTYWIGNFDNSGSRRFFTFYKYISHGLGSVPINAISFLYLASSQIGYKEFRLFLGFLQSLIQNSKENVQNKIKSLKKETSIVDRWRRSKSHSATEMESLKADLQYLKIAAKSVADNDWTQTLGILIWQLDSRNAEAPWFTFSDETPRYTYELRMSTEGRHN